jgi:hypothetical protein
MNLRIAALSFAVLSTESAAADPSFAKDVIAFRMLAEDDMM